MRIQPHPAAFSLIELVLVSAIIAIVASMIAPNFFQTRDQYVFHAEAQTLFDTLADARANAMASRECKSGDASAWWGISISHTLNAKPSYTLECQNTVHSDIQSEQTFPDASIKDNAIHLASITDATPTNFSNATTRIFFLSESGQMRIFDNAISKDTVIINLLHPKSQKTHAICMNRFAGFPKFDDCP